MKTKKKAKRIAVLRIDNCNDCMRHEFDNQEDPAKWGKHWCNDSNREIPDDAVELETPEIPAWCRIARDAEPAGQRGKVPRELVLDGRKYAGEWVATYSFTDNRVVSHGLDPSAVMDEARANGVADPVLVHVPKPGTKLLF